MLQQTNRPERAHTPTSPSTAPAATSPDALQLRAMSYEQGASSLAFYTVAPGDTLSKVAQKTLGGSSQWRVIYDANRDAIKNPNVIRPGQRLKIPGKQGSGGGGDAGPAPSPQTWVVRRGDTLSRIAQEALGSAARWREIWEANRAKLPDPNKLTVGQVLTLSGQRAPAPTPDAPAPTPDAPAPAPAGGVEAPSVLSPAALKKALDWYGVRRPHYPRAVAQRIQEKVGATADGAIGPKTVQAIAAYQKKSGLTVDGLAGPATLIKMFGEDIRPSAGGGGSEGGVAPGSLGFKRPHGLSEIIGVFGQPGKNLGSYAMYAGAGGKLITTTAHKLVGPIFQQVFADIRAAGLGGYIKSFDGIYNYRTKRKNSSSWSTHAWAISIDLNASGNPMVGSKNKHKMKISDGQAAIAPYFEKHGFYWGKHFGDPMHFQYCTGY